MTGHQKLEFKIPCSINTKFGKTEKFILKCTMIAVKRIFSEENNF